MSKAEVLDRNEMWQSNLSAIQEVYSSVSSHKLHKEISDYNIEDDEEYDDDDEEFENIGGSRRFGKN